MRTHGPGLILNTNWFVQPGQRVSQLANQELIDPGPGSAGYDANDHVRTCSPNGTTFHGIAFGGGGYFEIDMSFQNPTTSQTGSGWPAWWANNIEDAFPNTPGFLPEGIGIEYDAAEFLNTQPGPDGINAGIILWDATGDMWTSLDNGQPGGMLPVPTLTQRHKYAWLWVPATSTTQGYIKNYIDGVQRGNTYTWSRYVQNRTWAQTRDIDPWSPMDALRFKLMIGTNNENPLTIHTVTVWQRNDSANLRAGVPFPT